MRSAERMLAGSAAGRSISRKAGDDEGQAQSGKKQIRVCVCSN